MRRLIVVSVLVGLLVPGLAWGAGKASHQARAEAFLDLYNSLLVGLYTVVDECAWDARTDVTPEHDGARVAAGRAIAAFLGDRIVIETTKELLTHEDDLEPLTAR